jgi:predicted DCC family thiol-disulfide oxidoreductase YuxK
MASPDILHDGPVLLYDGNCGVCSQAVQWAFLKGNYPEAIRTRLK